MKTSKYYRLDEKVGGMRGGKSVIKRTTKKIKDYGIRAKKQVKLRMSKLGEKSFLGFKTKSHKARRKADKATGLSSRDREFIAKIKSKTGNRTGYSDKRKADKISKIMKKLGIENTNNTSSGSDRIKKRVNLINKAYTEKKKAYKNSFESNNETKTQKKSFLNSKQNYTDKKAEYNTLVKNFAIAESKRKLLKSSGLNTNQSKTLYTEAQTNAKNAQDALKKFNVKGLKNSREAFSKAEKKYSKRLTKKGSIEQLNTYSKNQTLGKRAGRTAEYIKKGVFSVGRALTSPLKTYRKIRGTRSSFTKLLNGSQYNSKTEIKNILRQEFDKNPEKRAKMEKYIYAMDALTLPKEIKLPPININQSWNSIKSNLKNIIEGKGLLETERNIIMDGYKSKFLMEHLKQDEKTMNKKVVKADRILIASNKGTLPNIQQKSLDRFISEKDALMNKYNLKANNINKLEKELLFKKLSDAEKAKIKETFNDGLKANQLSKKKKRIENAYNYLSNLKPNKEITNKDINYINYYNKILQNEKDTPNFERLTGKSVEEINYLLDKIKNYTKKKQY